MAELGGLQLNFLYGGLGLGLVEVHMHLVDEELDTGRGAAMRCSFKELGVNELDLVEIMLMLEEEFAV